MEQSDMTIKLIAATAVGAIGGLLLGSYLWGSKEKDTALSDHLSSLSKLIKEIEGIDKGEADELKKRIKTILNTIESSNVTAEE